MAFRIDKRLPDLDNYDWPDYLLFDSFSPQTYGGSGKKFSWEILKNKRFARPVILAGGLNPENVYKAILETGVDAVDVSSGVEVCPGIKDRLKLKKFIQQACLAFKERENLEEKKNAAR